MIKYLRGVKNFEYVMYRFELVVKQNMDTSNVFLYTPKYHPNK